MSHSMQGRSQVNKWWKYSDERPHRGGTLISREHCSPTSRQMLLKIEWSLLLLHTLQQRLPMIFNGPDNSPKVPLPVGGSQSPSNTWFLGPIGVSPRPQRHLSQFKRFRTAHPCDQRTDRQTDTQTTVSGLAIPRWTVCAGCRRRGAPSAPFCKPGSPRLPSPRFNMSNYGRRAFSFAGPRAWNSLPEYLRQASSLSVFKRSLKTYLFK